MLRTRRGMRMHERRAARCALRQICDVPWPIFCTQNSQKCVPMDMSCEQYAANYASDNSGSQPSSFEDQTDDLPEDATPPQQGDTTQPTQGDTTQQQQSDTTQQQQQQQQQSDNPPQSATGTTPQPDQPPPDSGKGASQGGDTVGVVSPGVLADVASVIVDDVAATNNEITCSTPRGMLKKCCVSVSRGMCCF